MLTDGLEGVNEDRVQPDESTTRPRPSAGSLVRKSIAGLGLVAVFFAVFGMRHWRAETDDSNSTTASSSRAMPSSPEIEEQYGVRFLGVDITAAGGMIQVRYQVLDSAKTQAIHDEESTPHVIAANGTDFGLPGMPGHTHIGPVKKAGTTDFVLLANSGGDLKAGSTVTIKIGDLELHDVPVN
jgi:hypothetical protein